MSLGAQAASPDVVIIGGGVAGLSVAVALAKHARVLLLEREALLSSHASGHNAAIYRPLEDDGTSAWLARRSSALSVEWLGAQPLSRHGVVLVSQEPARIAALAEHARREGVACDLLDRAALHGSLPLLAGGEAEHGLWLREGGVLDIHALTSGLARAARALGAELRTGSSVRRILREGARVRGVELADGGFVAARHVVIAAGAWAAELGREAGARVALTPMRRHLVQLLAAHEIARETPVVWRLEDEIYFRPESGGVLASPCDAQPWRAEVPASDPRALDLLAAKLARLSPVLASARVQRSWACLRTFAADRELVAGPHPLLDGLHFLSGLGGRGMSVAPAAAELVAQRVLGDGSHPLAGALSPARFSGE